VYEYYVVKIWETVSTAETRYSQGDREMCKNIMWLRFGRLFQLQRLGTAREIGRCL
jgi:hypothetical protein